MQRLLLAALLFALLALHGAARADGASVDPTEVLCGGPGAPFCGVDDGCDCACVCLDGLPDPDCVPLTLTKEEEIERERKREHEEQRAQFVIGDGVVRVWAHSNTLVESLLSALPTLSNMTKLAATLAAAVLLTRVDK